MLMPKATVDKDDGFVFGQNDINRNGADTPFWILAFWISTLELRNQNSPMQTEPISHSMQQGPYDFFRRRVFAADAGHIPASAFRRQTIQGVASGRFHNKANS